LGQEHTTLKGIQRKTWRGFEISGGGSIDFGHIRLLQQEGIQKEGS